MARIKLNKFIETATGRVGNLTFRQVGRSTVLLSRPVFVKPPSEKQLAQREKFRQAMKLAQERLKDPKLKAEYANRVKGLEFQHAYTAAVSEFLNANNEIEKSD